MFAIDLLGILTVGNSFFASWSYTWPPRCSREERTCCFLSFMTPLLGAFRSFFAFLGAIFYQTLEQWLNVRLLLSLRQLRRELSHLRKILLKNIDTLLLLSKMISPRQLDPQIHRSFLDLLVNLFVELVMIHDTLFYSFI